MYIVLFFVWDGKSWLFNLKIVALIMLDESFSWYLDVLEWREKSAVKQRKKLMKRQWVWIKLEDAWSLSSSVPVAKPIIFFFLETPATTSLFDDTKYASHHQNCTSSSFYAPGISQFISTLSWFIILCSWNLFSNFCPVFSSLMSITFRKFCKKMLIGLHLFTIESSGKISSNTVADMIYNGIEDLRFTAFSFYFLVLVFTVKHWVFPFILIFYD